MDGKVEARLKDLGVVLPAAPRPVANYVPSLISGNLLFISGQISMGADGEIITGQLGSEVSVDQGQAAAKRCAILILAQAKAGVGSLDRVTQVVKLTGFVNATADFGDHPKVINGASDFMVEVFGDKGRHTRAAVGVSSLPMNCAVEVDAILRIEQ
jgi:enamine deaminase RidA (YjgF/YER057c/UK114 family)